MKTLTRLLSLIFISILFFSCASTKVLNIDHQNKKNIVLLLDFPERDKSDFVAKLIYELGTDYHMVTKLKSVDIEKSEDVAEIDSATIKNVNKDEIETLLITDKDEKSVYVLKATYHVGKDEKHRERLIYFSALLINYKTGEKVRQIKLRYRKSPINYAVYDIIKNLNYEFHL